MTGFATSAIGCKVEVGIEAELGRENTPDGRPGVSVLLFASSPKVSPIGSSIALARRS
jgi:formylmethanofuran--tetrahydromethanopterin N-formyltransferase